MAPGRENWHVKKCSKCCTQCNKPFEHNKILYSRLLFTDGEYERQDFCRSCHAKEKSALSTWKTLFIEPPPPAEDTIKKENAETLLRNLLAKEQDDDLNAIFILTVMLERKKILIERAVQKSENGQKLRIYEHRKTGESFMILDPELKLDQLGSIQEEVVILLGGKPRNAEPTDPPKDQ